MATTISLDARGIRHLDQDIRTMTRKELALYFASARSGRILIAQLIKNIIWQAYERIQAGTEPPIGGNLRTFWYLWVKPVMAHIKDDEGQKTDPYDTMLVAFGQMVQDWRLFKYADFDFTDENWENRRIGTTRPAVLVFAEKAGWIRFLLALHDELGVSVLALGGQPSALTSEYTARDIKAALTGAPLAQLIGIVDYDPAGDIIARAFQSQLAITGLASHSLTTMIDPKYYTKAEIEMFKYPLPTKEKTKLANWLAKTGGIDGKAYGLESESMPRERLREMIQELIVAG